VQNFDNSIVTIPSYALLSSSLKNWRGMTEAGGRRVKRAVHIDITTIKLCDKELLARLSQVVLLQAKFGEKLKGSRRSRESMLLHNQITNISALRYYLESYLAQHPDVHQGMRILVRPLQASATGLPIELYFYTKNTDTEGYEAVQADILDHIYAVLPTFDLRAFQYVSGGGD
jgi:miniconductance mechanosensitive channel